jgi:myo-inositol catabolism protein IolS
MNYRTLGKTGLRVSEISLGMWAIGGGDWGPVDDRDSLAAVQRAWDMGVNLFDTADVYGRGHSETLLAGFLKTVPRDKVIVATKVGLWRGRQPNPYTDPTMIIEDCEASLKRLGIDYIDVYQDHVWWDENTEVFAEAMGKLKQQGKVRFVGLSTNEPDYIQHFDQAINGMDTLQIDYSLLNRQPEKDALLYCQEHNIGVIVKGPLAMGKLTGKFTPVTTFAEGDVRQGWLQGENRDRFLRDLAFVDRLRSVSEERSLAQLALAYVLANPAVSTLIPGAKTPRQVEENLQASAHPLSQETLKRIAGVAAQSTD